MILIRGKCRIYFISHIIIIIIIIITTKYYSFTLNLLQNMALCSHCLIFFHFFQENIFTTFNLLSQLSWNSLSLTLISFRLLDAPSSFTSIAIYRNEKYCSLGLFSPWHDVLLLLYPIIQSPPIIEYKNSQHISPFSPKMWLRVASSIPVCATSLQVLKNIVMCCEFSKFSC